MKENFVRHTICDGVNFNVIKDERFKTARISFSMFMPLLEETAAQNAILPFLLTRSCKNYPDFTSLNRCLSSLYGASISPDINKIGESQILTISSSFLEDRYALDNENISSKITQLICDLVFAPLLENQEFNKADFEQEKRQLLELIDSEYNDKRIFAKNRCEEIMCKDENYGVNKFGKKQQVKNLTAKRAYLAWQEVLESSHIEIMFLGSSEHTQALNLFKQAFKNIKRNKVFKGETKIISKPLMQQEHIDHMEVSQSKMVLGFRAGEQKTQQEINAMRLAVALFGATPHSKLFLNVREKLSLCYYCAAKYDKNKELMLVQSGIMAKNIEKAKSEILRQLDEVKRGNFTTEELHAIKMSVSNSFITVGDYLSGLETFYLAQTFQKEKFSPEQIAKQIEQITVQEVIAAAQKLTLDTVYILKQTKEEDHE